jgi:2-haloacid dehalogenase
MPDAVLVFDVNETLLDLSALDPLFDRAFGDPAARREWFAQLLQSALVSVATGVHSDFGVLGDAALRMVAARRGLELADAERRAVLAGMRDLPPHPDVRPALERLRAAGFRLATLTNSPPAVAEGQLANAGIAEAFDARLSVEGAGVLKPAARVYRYAATRLGVEPGDLRLIAAHAWDVTGALRAGCAAAFVARPGMVLDPSGETPDVVGRDLGEVADRLLDARGSS